MSPSTLCGIAAILLWSSLATLTTLLAGIGPLQILAITFGTGGVLGMLWLLRPRGEGLRGLRQPWPAALLAIVALLGYHLLYLIALSHAPVVEANLLNYLWPLLIVAFAGLLPDVTVSARQWLGTALGLAAAALVVTRGEALQVRAADLPGYLAAGCAALAWSAYSVLNRRFAAAPSSAIAGSCVVVAVLAAILHLVFERWTAPTPLQWAVLLAMGLGPVGAAFWLWDRGTKHGDLPVLGALSYAAPLLSTALLLVTGRGTPHWTQGAAIALLLTGAWLSTSRRAAEGGARPAVHLSNDA